jgi:hypothetical protein
MKFFAKNTLLLVSFTLIFVGLILFNQEKAQQSIATGRVPRYQVTLINPPSQVVVDTLVDFKWQVDTPEFSATPLTTIYYGHVSSPSAITTKDSPVAVGYPYRLTDYLNGQFSLPDTFSSRMEFPEGNIFYRAYAKVGDQHLWSEELHLVVTQ